VQDPTPIEITGYADAWQFWGKTILIFYIFALSTVQKTFPRQ